MTSPEEVLLDSVCLSPARWTPGLPVVPVDQRLQPARPPPARPVSVRLPSRPGEHSAVLVRLPDFLLRAGGARTLAHEPAASVTHAPTHQQRHQQLQ